MASVLSTAERLELAGRARTLSSRYEPEDTEIDGTVPDNVDDDILSEWIDVLDTMEEDRGLKERLAFEGRSREDVREAIAATTWPESEPLPEWVDRADCLIEAVQSTEPTAETGTDDVEREVPFYAIFEPIVQWAFSTLPDETTDRLSHGAREGFESWLFDRLWKPFVRVLFVEFKTFVTLRDPQRGQLDPDEYGGASYPTEYYQAFVRSMYEGDFKPLCLEYPVFTRLLSARVRQWQQEVTEILERLAADSDAIVDRFGVPASVDSVQKVEALAEDTHNDGRAVWKITVADGEHVVYKPRPVVAEQSFYETLERFDDYSEPPSFETPALLDGGEYGWMEWVSKQACDSERAVQRYYRRAGALLCLGYVTAFTDCHHENLIAAGEYPILVDAETAFHPLLRLEDTPKHNDYYRFVNHNLFVTGAVPWVRDVDVGTNVAPRSTKSIGFGPGDERATIPSVPTFSFEAKNTDLMMVSQTGSTIDLRSNTPTFDGQLQSIEKYVEEVCAGFRETYETLRKCRENGELFRDGGLLEPQTGIERRYIFRPTLSYVRLLRKLQSQSVLRDGAKFAVRMEELCADCFDGYIEDSSMVSLCLAEQDSLTRFDVPRLTVPASGGEIRVDGDPSGVSVDVGPDERVRQRVEALSEDDMAKQLDMIKLAYNRDTYPDPETGGPDEVEARPPGGDGLPSSIDRSFQSEAAALVDRIKTASFDGDKHKYSWITTIPDPTVDSLVLRSTRESLYTGRPGIALPAAGLYRSTGQSRYQQFSLDVLQPARNSITWNTTGVVTRGFGGAIGAGATIYGLSLLGELLDAEADALHREARLIVNCYDTDAILSADKSDVFNGLAGSILGLLKYYQCTGDEQALELAAVCGDRILELRTDFEGYRVWETDLGTQPLTGFSHGTSGVAYAIYRLGTTLEDDRYRTAALEAIDYENSVYDPERRNWPDFRPDSDRFVDRWCHGRSGVALARLGILRAAKRDGKSLTEITTPGGTNVLETVETALSAIPAPDGLRPADHICCGTFGRVECLYTGAKVLDREEELAKTYAATILQKADRLGEYVQNGQVSGSVDPSFFNGIAGIGYTLLRLDGNDLPNVLLWE